MKYNPVQVQLELNQVNKSALNQIQKYQKV